MKSANLVGRSLRHFRVTAELGEGGMGRVFRAEDTRLNRSVALKLLPDEVASDPERIARFKKEAEAIAALSHPNVVAIHSIEEAEGLTFLAMELVEGETLDRLIPPGGLPLDRFLELAVALADALAAAHARGIVHRDLKPENVMVDAEGRVKVLDFGLAKLRREPAGDLTQVPTGTLEELTREGQIVGTVPYMSPEQVQGRTVDSRSDLFSLGAVLYEMATGHRPFGGETSVEVLSSILRDEPASATDLRPELPAQLARVLRRCLTKDPERRFQSAKDLRNELEELRDELTVARTVRPEPATPAGGATRRARPVVAALAALIGLAILAGVLVYTSREPTPLRDLDQSIAVLPFEAIGAAPDSPFADGVHNDLLTRLSNIGDLQVISRTSVNQYRGTTKPIPEIAAELGTAWIVEGAVLQMGDQIQVNAQLIDASTDTHLWANSYQKTLTAENIFALQAEITEDIARSLEARLSPAEQARLDRVPTENLDSYTAYVQGRTFLDTRTEAGMNQALVFFRSAVEEDPNYALAWVGLADALTLLHDYGYEAPEAVLPEAEDAIRRALELDPELAAAHASLGLLHGTRLDGPGAVRALQRAVELQPSYAEAHNWLSWVSLVLGYPEEALAAARRAVALDPRSGEALANLVLSYIANGSIEQALLEAERAEAMGLPFTDPFYKGLALYELERYGEAASVLDGLTAVWAGEGPRATLALAHAAAGEEERARRLLASIEQEDDLFAAGLVRAALGEREEAFAAFGRIEEWGYWPALAVHHLYGKVLDPLRGDPRFRELVRDLNRYYGLEPDGSFPDGLPS